MRGSVTYLCIVFIVFGLLCGSIQSLKVLSPPAYAGEYNSPGFMHWGRQNFSFSTVLVYVPDGGCKEVDAAVAAKVAGNAAYVGQGFQGCSFQEVARRMQALGANSVVFAAIGGLASQDPTITDGLPDGDISIAAVEIDWDRDAYFIDGLKASGQFSVVIETNPNPWFGPYDTVAFQTYGAIIGILCFFNLCLALLKLFWYLRHRGLKISTLMLLLIFQSISNLLRIIFLWGDPHGSQYKFNWLAQRMLSTLHEPFSLIAECLTLLCWYDLLTITNTRSAAFLNGKWPRILFGVIGVILLGIEFGTSIPHGKFASGQDASRGAIIVYAIVHLFCAISYIVLGRKLIAVLSNAGSQSEHLKKVSRSAIGSATFLILLIICFIVMATPMFWEPWGFCIIWLFVWLCISVASTFQIGSLTPPKWPGLARVFFGKWMAPVSIASSSAQSNSATASTTRGSSAENSSSVSASASGAEDV